MARIQQNLFSWQELDEVGDLERLQLVIDTLEDEKLMQILEKERGKGRDDNPVRAMWNSILAGVVYQHESIESLRRELKMIGRIAKKCSLPVSTVRYYNQLGLIDEICRTPGGVRLYNRNKTVRKIKKIRTINHGRTLEQIKEQV